MNTGRARRQQPAPRSRVAAALLSLEPMPAATGHDDDLTGLPDLGPTAALTRQVSPDRRAALAGLHRQCRPSKARS